MKRMTSMSSGMTEADGRNMPDINGIQENQEHSGRRKRIRVGIFGNPNSGKSSLFNELTGARQHVGNWPGVTVEKKTGYSVHGSCRIEWVDLPGIYSLTAFTMEETIARDYLLNEKPDAVVNVVDASQLDRNLYLTTELLELGIPAILALNMSDEADGKGVLIDRMLLTRLLGLPAVRTVGNRGIGAEELVREVIAAAQRPQPPMPPSHVSYGEETEEELRILEDRIRMGSPANVSPGFARWLSVKLLENDTHIHLFAQRTLRNADAIIREAELCRARIEKSLCDDPETVVADRRYGFIKGLLSEVTHRSLPDRRRISEMIDTVLTNRWLGIPILVGLLWTMFQATFVLGAYPKYWIESGIGLIAGQIGSILSEGPLKSLLVDGVISGVGGVLSFLPNILILFFFISLFEDTGYMARIAFIMDRVMHTLGLHGKSFIPMVMGFGCNVPAMMAARTLENESDRILTILINPLVSCSARLPVYIILSGAFFPEQAGNIIFAIYLTGLILAVLVGQLFRRLFFKAAAAPFVMELPPYRLPLLRNVVRHMWNKGAIFVRKVGGTILAASVILWGLCFFPIREPIHGSGQAVAMSDADKSESLEFSCAAALGRAIEPVVRPLGFDWRAALALLSGVAAKEIVVSTFGVLYKTGRENEALKAALRRHMSPSAALAFMFFTLIYIPCIGTLGAMVRELGSVRWTAFGAAYSLILAWFVAFVVYRVGLWIGVGGG
jgi:ferrous iron transport protein B